MSTKAVPIQVISDKPSEKFRKAMRQILSVPKKELDRRETEYRKHRAATKARKPGL